MKFFVNKKNYDKMKKMMHRERKSNLYEIQKFIFISYYWHFGIRN